MEAQEGRRKGNRCYTCLINRLALITDIKGRSKLEEIRDRYIDDVDLIIAEGYKTERYQKIEVIRDSNSKKLLCSKGVIILLQL